MAYSSRANRLCASFRNGAAVIVLRLIGLLATTGPAFAEAWPAVASDLPADPLLKQGVLPNGLRYAILPNAEPRDRISLRLLVAAGSLHESDDERGLAHFVEHMAFRGTRSFPGSSLTSALQRIGVGIGPDNTAFTSYDHTIYHLELPDAKESTLHLGLRAFREYADAVVFDPQAIDAERGVVLSEMNTRDTPEDRTREANLHFVWPDSREAQRKVIGTPVTLRNFTREQFIAFYNAWYRPERLAVVVVGAVSPSTAEKLIAEHFSSFAARGPARAEPELVTTKARSTDVQVFSDPGIIGFSLSFQHARSLPERTDDHPSRVLRTHEALAFTMFGARLQRLSNQPDASFLTPAAQVSTGLRKWQLAVVSAAGKINDWKRVAMDIEAEHRRAFLHGFTQRELAEAKLVLATSLEQSVRSASTRPSPWLAAQLVNLLLHGGTFVTPADLERDLSPVLAAATLDDCIAAFRTAWSPQAPGVFIATHPSFSITRQQIADALNESRRQPVTAPAEIAVPEFAYADFGPPGKIVHEQQLQDLDVRLSRFTNGVRLNFKSTDFTADNVEVRVRIGDGKIVQPPDKPGINILAGAAFTAGGVGRHSAQELSDILASHALQLQFEVESDAFVFVGHCARRELPLALKVIAAFLTDASYRPEVMRETQARFNSMYASLAASPRGPITMVALQEVLNGDRRFGVPQFEELAKRNLQELAAWLDPHLKQAPIELSIVGDVTWTEASAAVAATLGALPTRLERSAKFPGVPLRFSLPPKPGAQKIYPIAPTLKQVGLAWFWPVPVPNDIHVERRCTLLAMVVMERLRVKLREELGATYAPGVEFSRFDGFPGIGIFDFYAEIQPARALQALQIVQRELADLAKNGPTADEFERTKQPYLRERADNLRTNAYWGGTVLRDAQQHPERIAAARDRTADTASIQRSDLTALARLYLQPALAFRFITLPVAVNNPATPTPAAPAAPP